MVMGLLYHRRLWIPGILILFAGAIYFHEQIGQSILDAGERCIIVILPSLYLFSILAAFCIKSGMLEQLAEPFGKHRAKAVIWLIVIFSQMGGYPTGAQLLHSLYQEGGISREQEEKLLCACMGSGFGFLFATVGGNLRTALMLWLILSVPNWILAYFFIRSMPSVNQNSIRSESKTFSALLTESVESAAAAMLKICGMILAFGALMGILNGISGEIPPLIGSILEISSLSEYTHHGGSLPVAAGLLSFGGLCVHIQIAAVCENHIDWKRFWICRILTAGISGLLCTFSMNFLFPESVPVFLEETTVSIHSSSSMIPTCCLLVMSVFVLKKYDFFHKILTNEQK